MNALYGGWVELLIQQQARMLSYKADPREMISTYHDLIDGLVLFIQDEKESDHERTGAGVYDWHATGQHGVQRSGPGGSP